MSFSSILSCWVGLLWWLLHQRRRRLNWNQLQLSLLHFRGLLSHQGIFALSLHCSRLKSTSKSSRLCLLPSHMAASHSVSHSDRPGSKAPTTSKYNCLTEYQHAQSYWCYQCQSHLLTGISLGPLRGFNTITVWKDHLHHLALSFGRKPGRGSNSWPW